MGTKNNPGAFDCYANAKPDEPMFILLARDAKAPSVVREWARMYRAQYAGDWTPERQRKYYEAVDCADAMQAWAREPKRDLQITLPTKAIKSAIATGMKELVRSILLSATQFEWSLQGMGMLRLHMGNNTRLHIWDSRFRAPGASMIHDHLQWGLHSTIVAGELINRRYAEGSTGSPYMARTLKPGYGYFWKDDARRVYLEPLKLERYVEGESYRQEPSEIHETDAYDGTVTLMSKTPTDDESATVFWPVGTEWGSAEPKKATPEQVSAIVANALATWF